MDDIVSGDRITNNEIITLLDLQKHKSVNLILLAKQSKQ